MPHFDTIEHGRKWIVRVDGRMVLECKNRRVALATVRRANDLMRASAEGTCRQMDPRAAIGSADQPMPMAASNSRRTSAG